MGIPSPGGRGTNTTAGVLIDVCRSRERRNLVLISSSNAPPFMAWCPLSSPQGQPPPDSRFVPQGLVLPAHTAAAMKLLDLALALAALPAVLALPVGNTTTDDTVYDAIIVGGGPSGLAALSALGRVRRKTLLIDSGEYRNAPTRHMHDVLGFDGGLPFISPPEAGTGTNSRQASSRRGTATPRASRSSRTTPRP